MCAKKIDLCAQKIVKKTRDAEALRDWWVLLTMWGSSEGMMKASMPAAAINSRILMSLGSAGAAAAAGGAAPGAGAAVAIVVSRERRSGNS